MHELTLIMPQKDDQPFAKLLNRMREGMHTAENISHLQTCVVTGNDIESLTIPHPTTLQPMSSLLHIRMRDHFISTFKK